MEEKELKIMIERFFDAELTVDEERALCRYLRDNDVPAELRKDKDAVIALYNEPADVQLPVGAMERLEALIDGLEPQQEQCITDSAVAVEKKKRLLKIPRYAAVAATAMAMVVMAYIFIPSENPSSPESTEELMTEIYEEDTFDNPEDAMQCLKMVLGDMQQAAIIAHANTKNISAILEMSAIMCNKQ